MPTMIVWGERDNTIPIEHGRRAHEAIPNSRFRTLPRAAHFPHLEEPEALVAVLREFLNNSEPCEMDDADWGALLSRRAPRRRRLADAAA
ncbi:MAG: alpha/beta hydrolase, partial [Solirubrobacteraceae bacterium]